MDEALLAAYRATTYRVRLARGGWAAVRIDAALPRELLALVGAHRWSVLTAWNPRSVPRPRADNRDAQHRLLGELKSCCKAIVAAEGVGSQWREASLFAVGPDMATMDTYARRYQQNAYVHGEAGDPAMLRVL
jgi:Protein of unknown function (DUF3293)